MFDKMIRGILYMSCGNKYLVEKNQNNFCRLTGFDTWNLKLKAHPQKCHIFDNAPFPHAAHGLFTISIENVVSNNQ